MNHNDVMLNSILYNTSSETSIKIEKSSIYPLNDDIYCSINNQYTDQDEVYSDIVDMFM